MRTKVVMVAALVLTAPPYIVMRIYWPKEAALNGSWKPPAVQRAK